MKYVIKTTRITAWLLVIATLFTLLFGFLALKPFITHHISADLSMYFHNIFLPLVFIPLFFIHSLCGTILAIHRQQWIRNKKAWQIAAGILWVGTLVVFGVLYFIPSPGAKTPAPKTQNNTVTGATTLTLSEVQKHNTQSDCWIIINNKVYDLTSYFGIHPGGNSVIAPYCGTDGTNAFNTKDRTRAQSHSSYANSLLDSYYIGDVGSQADSQKIQNIQSQPSQSTGQGQDD